MIRIAFCQTNRLFILLERAEKEIRFPMANGMFKTKMDIDRHGPRLMPNNCKNLNPPYFSLPYTFKENVSISKQNCLQFLETGPRINELGTKKLSVILSNNFLLFLSCLCESIGSERGSYIGMYLTTVFLRFRLFLSTY